MKIVVANLYRHSDDAAAATLFRRIQFEQYAKCQNTNVNNNNKHHLVVDCRLVCVNVYTKMGKRK